MSRRARPRVPPECPPEGIAASAFSAGGFGCAYSELVVGQRKRSVVEVYEGFVGIVFGFGHFGACSWRRVTSQVENKLI